MRARDSQIELTWKSREIVPNLPGFFFFSSPFCKYIFDLRLRHRLSKEIDAEILDFVPCALDVKRKRISVAVSNAILVLY